ncbi:hypothetical protein C2S51_032790 [Perilla frutescens var. frutescens]|nr:hypothetical protein C2S51_032790 [Perilla frutescens var. frutescens]
MPVECTTTASSSTSIIPVTSEVMDKASKDNAPLIQGLGKGLLPEVPTQYPAGLGMINCVRNERAPTDSHPTKRVREEEPVYVQQNVDMSANTSLHLNKPGHIGLLLNPNPGLRLSSSILNFRLQLFKSYTADQESLWACYLKWIFIGYPFDEDVDEYAENLNFSSPCSSITFFATF